MIADPATRFFLIIDFLVTRCRAHCWIGWNRKLYRRK